MKERILTCPVCGKEFATSHPTKKYCSMECYEIKKLERQRNEETTRQCRWCGRDFEPSHGNQRYCSSDCYGQANKERCKKRYHSGHKLSSKAKTCPVCHREFITHKSNRKYCSKECYRQAHRSRYDKHYHRDYYRSHREALRKSHKKYYNANREWLLEHRRNRENKDPAYDHEFYKRLEKCCNRHGGPDNCPYSDCIALED